jgi:hypothetical protein
MVSLKIRLNPVSNDTAGVINSTNDEGVEVYTYVRMNKQRTQWVWHQEVFDYDPAWFPIDCT